MDMNMENELLSLTNLIDIALLQQLQDAFSNMTGMAALTTDKDGIGVTKGSHFAEFCDYTRKTPEGFKRCEKCDREGSRMALAWGKSVTYYCHAGLVEFAAPIVAGDMVVGCFIGGQVLTKPVDEDEICKIAKEIGVDTAKYLEAAQKVSIMPKGHIEKAAESLYAIANVFSNIAYSKFQLMLANVEIERAANMKADFLANMSHEIRTPMNAVIGMAEMALREGLTPQARDYIGQIRSSGKELLTIINDILDFSKIESGKMDITDVEYEPMSVVNDVSNIIMTRIGDKDLELTVDIAPDIPHKLYGDNVRLEQIIINLANNAVKFTSSGQVAFQVQYERTDQDTIDLKLSVKDTGIGIKQEDMGKLFESFQQLDSKRNRNIEGTGLGLAITKQLVDLMHGSITVDSEYERGSIFVVKVPQKIVEDVPSIPLNEDIQIIAGGVIANHYIQEQLVRDCQRMGVRYIYLRKDNSIGDILDQNIDFVFIEETVYSRDWQEFARSHPEITVILMVDFRSTTTSNLPNLRVVKKPLYALNLSLIFSGQELHNSGIEQREDDFNFVAPEARILIVDDNAINLTVATGLLNPLEMHVDEAKSGFEALEKINEKMYDLIFMDHMMPEMDGVETTQCIRERYPEYDMVPIIALTANAVGGVKDMFVEAGMNDFVAKPIELKTLVQKVRQWLPPEKIHKLFEVKAAQPANEKSEIPVISDLDVASSIKLLGSEKLFYAVLRDYYRVIGKKADVIEQYEAAADWQNYTVEVHALKSASKQIGATELSEMALKLEEAGNVMRGSEDAVDREAAESYIRSHTAPLLERYRQYKEALAPHCEEQEQSQEDKKAITKDVLQTLLEDLKKAAEDLDMDEMENIVQHLHEYRYDDEEKEFLEKIAEAAAEMDVDTCTELVEEWQSRM